MADGSKKLELMREAVTKLIEAKAECARVENLDEEWTEAKFGEANFHFRAAKRKVDELMTPENMLMLFDILAELRAPKHRR